MITIKDYFEPLMLDDTEELTGIFSALEKSVKNQMKPDEILTKIFDGNGTILDIDYVYTHAYTKWIALVLERLTELVKTQQPSISDSRAKVIVLVAYIVPLLLKRFSEIWKKKYVAITADYTPTNDYKENEKVDYTSHGVDTPQTTTTSKTSTDTTQSTSVTQNANTYAFDSISETPTALNTGDQSVNSTGAPDKNYTETTTGGTNTSDVNSTNTITREGKHGSTDYSVLIENELKLREYDFYQEMFKDIDSILTLSIY
jgi:hypothetical protein